MSATTEKFGYRTKTRNLDQNINDSKSHIWNSFLFFFESITSVSGIKLFYTCPHVSVDFNTAFFNSLIF